MKLSRVAYYILALLVIAVSIGSWPVIGQGPESYSFVTLAGLSPTGSADGTGSVARFNDPEGMTVDGTGAIYVADTENHTIRKITPAGVVTTFAGSAGVRGSADGTGSAARFFRPNSVAADTAGNVYVADGENHTIRKITPAGVVTTLAGLAGMPGSADGTGSVARFFFPTGVAVDGGGTVYVSDSINHTIRRVTAAGVVTTLAGLAGSQGSANGTGSVARFSYPRGLAVDGSGVIYVADTSNCTIRRVTAAGVVTTLAGLAGATGSGDGTGSDARFMFPAGLTVDGNGVLSVADTSNHTIRRVTAAGVVTTLAGSPTNEGSMDGTGAAAGFSHPGGIAAGAAGILYVGDSANNTIRAVTAAGVVTTLAGLAVTPGSADGTGSAARFTDPNGVAVDGGGTVYVADTYSYTIRKITPAGVVTTLAGLAGFNGSTDGTGSTARFDEARGIAVDNAGNVYVGDTNNHTIRKITPGGVVTTLAGLAGQMGSVDATGSAARFDNPHGVAVDSDGNVYVADQTNHTIRKVTAAGVVTTLAGLAGEDGSSDGTGSAARFSYPRSVAVDGAGVVYVADSNNYTIRRITPDGNVTTLAGLAGNDGFADGTGSAARFSEPNGIAATTSGTVFVADTYNFSVRKITPAGVVTTIGGLVNSQGTADGTGPAARFGEMKGVAVDPDLNVYVADTDNHTIRKGTPPGVNTAPSITTQPTSQIIPYGTTVLLSVSATGTAPFTYQWYEGASPNTVSPVIGATASTYMTPALTFSTGYWVRVTNVAGAADSNTATITVSPEGPDVIANGTFSAGTANWAVFEEPDMVSSVINGVFHFHKANPLTTASRQAVVFQQTGQAIASGQAVLAEFDLGNTDVVRKRISVLIIDSNFSDITVCTFWLPANAPLQTYRMRTHATQAWANASIYFYAASVGTGDYQLDNVELHTDAAGSDSQTGCIDPTTPLPPGGAAGPNLLANGDFGTGQLSPWFLFGDITSQIANGVFEFVRPGTPGLPAGVIAQNTGAAMPVNQILTTSLQLGNSSAVRKRVTVLVHEGDFSDLAACTFWIPPGQTLSTYMVRSFTTKAWVNATVSVYGGNVNAQPWIQLDNVTLQRTPSAAIQGTECLEPESVSPAVAGALASRAASAASSVRDGGTNADRSAADEPIGVTLWRSAGALDLTDVTVGRLKFFSRLQALASPGLLQASVDGVTWITVAIVLPSPEWEEQEVELDSLAGRRVYLRIVSAFGSGR